MRSHGRQLACRRGQEPNIHSEADLLATVAWAKQIDRKWVSALSNAALGRYVNLVDLNEVDWEAIPALCSQIQWSERPGDPGSVADRALPEGHERGDSRPLMRARASRAGSARKSGPCSTSHSRGRTARLSLNRPSCHTTVAPNALPIGYQSFAIVFGIPFKRPSRCARIWGVSGDGCNSSRSHPCTTGPIGTGSRSGRLCGWFAQ